jgi:hypothetical protein
MKNRWEDNIFMNQNNNKKFYNIISVSINLFFFIFKVKSNQTASLRVKRDGKNKIKKF